MLVEELMTTDVVTVDRGATLDEAVDLLLTHGIGSVVVVADGDPTGIVTESDALGAALETGRPLSDLPVANLRHDSLVTTSPGRSAQRVARRMADENVKKLPVVEGMDVVGIITHSDVVWHISDIRREASTVDAARDRWESGEGL